MISIFNSSSTFSLSAIQAIRTWANVNLIENTSIINSVQLIWDDMHEPNTGQPTASSMAYTYVQGPIFKERIYVNPPEEDWARINAWFEVEEGVGTGYDPETGLGGEECQPTDNIATNTRVEITPMTLAWQDLTGGQYGDGAWHTLQAGDGIIAGSRYPAEHGGDYDTDRGCPIDGSGIDYHLEREANPLYDPTNGTTVDGNYLYLPDHYWWYHGWTTQESIDPDQFNAVYAGCYARLVLIDPDGEDDRWKAHFVAHVSSDKKNSTGGIVGGGQDTGGISRYKRIPTDGSWIPINWVTGWVTLESLTATPPPFPTNPQEIVDYNLDTLWNDSYYACQMIPCAHSIWNYAYLIEEEDGTARSFEPAGPNINDDYTWSANVYWEICNNSITNNSAGRNTSSCEFTNSSSTNTAVETGHCSYYYKKVSDQQWYPLMDDEPQKYDVMQVNPPDGAPYKACDSYGDIVSWLDSDRPNANNDMRVEIDGLRYWKPKGGIFPHVWTEAVNFPLDLDFNTEVDAIAVAVFARLVQIDDTLPNDFHLAEMCCYAGTDTKGHDPDTISGTIYNNFACSVQGHFKQIPQSGEWIMFGCVRGISTKEEWDGNPAPLPTSPS